MGVSSRALPFVLIVTTAVGVCLSAGAGLLPHTAWGYRRPSRQATYGKCRQSESAVVSNHRTVVGNGDLQTELQPYSGWLARVRRNRADARFLRAVRVSRVANLRGPVTSRGLALQLPAIDWRILWWAAALVMTSTGAFTWVSTRRYLDRRRLLVAYMTAFGHAIRERIRATVVSQSAGRRGESARACDFNPGAGDWRFCSLRRPAERIPILSIIE